MLMRLILSGVRIGGSIFVSTAAGIGSVPPAWTAINNSINVKGDGMSKNMSVREGVPSEAQNITQIINNAFRGYAAIFMKGRYLDRVTADGKQGTKGLERGVGIIIVLFVPSLKL